MPKRYSIVPPRTSDDSVLHLDQVEQQIITTMMKIDANISRANNIINDEIIPIIREYGQTTEAIGDSVEFWKRLFESSANVIIDTKDDVTTATANPTAPPRPNLRPPALVTPSDDPSISFNSIEGHTGAAPIYRKRTPSPTKPAPPTALKAKNNQDTDTLESQPKLDPVSERYLDQHQPQSTKKVQSTTTKKSTIDLYSSPNRVAGRAVPPSSPTRATPRRPQPKPPASQVGNLQPVSLAPTAPEAYESGFRAGYRAGLSPLRSPQFDVSSTISPPRPRLSEYTQSMMDRRPPPRDDSSSLLAPPQLETEIVPPEQNDSLHLPSSAGLPPTSPAQQQQPQPQPSQSSQSSRKPSLMPSIRLRTQPSASRLSGTHHEANINDNDDDDEVLPFVRGTPERRRYTPPRSKTMVFTSSQPPINPAVTPRATRTSPLRSVTTVRRQGYYRSTARKSPLPPRPLSSSPRRPSPQRVKLTSVRSGRLSPQKSVRYSIGSPNRNIRFFDNPSSPHVAKGAAQQPSLASAPANAHISTTQPPLTNQPPPANQPPPMASQPQAEAEEDEDLKKRLGPELYARFMAIRRG
ncbi:hypothetical protein DIURU_004372 [Diutina rugosa]|uniref:DASH complex subunit ASK1 n=1 Tax=Diutina rugosa TaxID=5481 RepID=A0A642UM38_DIURU|nr:uncharacterized protein DIURU_004372 [Diutina rugosa]KAA8899350.1 hypothetical protein DIURU_004372 [Diutina rugosa]